jgi:hypothetical protein
VPRNDGESGNDIIANTYNVIANTYNVIANTYNVIANGVKQSRGDRGTK